MKAKAAVLYELHKPLVVEDIDVDDPKEGEVLVRVVASGVCHTDQSFIDGYQPWVPLPIVLGHEGAGVVEKVGPGVTSVQPGDHVVLSWVPACGRCYYCTIGRPSLCIGHGMFMGTMKDGTTRLHKDEKNIGTLVSVGSFSQYTVVPQETAIKVRPDAPLDKVALIGCGVMTGVGAAINTAEVKPGSSVVVVGCGGVGLNVVQGAMLAGAEKVIAIDLLDNKLELAKVFGATHTINSSRENAVAKVRELTQGLGAEYAIEVVGLPETILLALNATRSGGTCVVVGFPPAGAEVSIPIMTIFMERTLKGCVYGSARMRVDIPRLVDLYLDGRLKLDELITGTFPITAINTTLDLLKKGEAVRSVIVY